jgi:putative flippase GtrA
MPEHTSWIRNGTLVGQGVRFAASGGFVALVYIGTTSLLAEVVGLPFELALAIGFGIAITTHFTLQRLFVWAHVDEYALPLGAQLARYLVLAGTQYGLTALAIATLPQALEVATEVVYIVTAGLLTIGTFLLLRARVFQPHRSTTA